jgi:hypothetical protein
MNDASTASPAVERLDAARRRARLVPFDPGDRIRLRRLCSGLGEHANLRFPDFVNHYYAGSEWCRLHMLLGDRDEALGLIGVERMPFTTPDGVMVLGFGTNFRAYQPGVGGVMLLHWLRECDFGLVFGGNELTHRILKQQKWTWHTGIRSLRLDEARKLRPVPDLPAVRLREETVFDDDLLPRRSPFAFRFAPDVPYLNWRYGTTLPFVRYRVFRVLSSDRTAGYVVLNLKLDALLVAQCDGDDVATLVAGVLEAIRTVREGDRQRQPVSLVASHPVMISALSRAGFHEHGAERPFIVGGRNEPPPIPSDTGTWLVNLDWGDNGLRYPFLGQPHL